MEFLTQLLLLIRQLVDRLLTRIAHREERHDRPEYAGPFVADTLDRLERLAQDYIYVGGRPVTVRVTEVKVRSLAFVQVVEVSLLAWQLSGIPPSGDRLLRVPAELSWTASPESQETVRIELPQSFFYTLTSELSVDENLVALTDYIKLRFENGSRLS